MKILHFKEQLLRYMPANAVFTNPEQEIYTFMPFSPETSLEQHILYIGSGADILMQESGLPVNFLCFRHSPEENGSETQDYARQYPHANFIFITLENNRSPQSALDIASKIFLAENRYTSQINQLLTAFDSNCGLQHLINEAYRINKSPIIVIDASYRILAMYRDNPADEQLDLSAQRKLGYLTEHNLERMKRDKIYERLRESDIKLLYGKASDSDYYWIDMLVYIHGIEVAEIGVIEYDHTFTNYDFEFFLFLKQLVAWEMQQRNFTSPHLMQMHGLFLLELLEQTFITPQAIESRSRMLGWKKAPFLYIFTVFPQEPTNVRRKAEVVSIQLANLLPDCRWTIRDDCLVFLIMKEDDCLDAFAPHSPLAERLSRNKMYGILSNCFSDLADIRKYYRQTLHVREYKTYFAPQDPISLYTDFYIYHIAKILSETQELKDFYHPMVQKIQAYDAKNHTNYLETLAEYLTHIDNPSISAKNLCVHKNTFFYRMNKIKELFAIDLKDGIERMKLLLTIEFMKLES